MKIIIQLALAVSILGAASVPAVAQGTERNKTQTTFSVEIDPATFAFGGYSAHIRIQPGSSDHILLGAGIYAMNMPSFFVDLNKENKEEGWNVRLNQGIGFFIEHHFLEVNRKWFLGAQMGTQQYEIETSNFEGTKQFTNALLMGYGGYTLQPFHFPLYFKAWGGWGYTSKISGVNTLAGKEYTISPLTVFATLHIGYTF